MNDIISFDLFNTHSLWGGGVHIKFQRGLLCLLRVFPPPPPTVRENKIHILSL